MPTTGLAAIASFFMIGLRENHKPVFPVVILGVTR